MKIYATFERILFTVISLTNTQAIASRFWKVTRFLPTIFLPRFAFGANLPFDQTKRLFDQIPSLRSQEWTEYWIEAGQKFEAKENWRVACMCYILGCFPKENRPWKDRINELKRESFGKWCAANSVPFEERILHSPEGKIRYYLFKPKFSSPGKKVPLTLFVNGLEGSAEEIAFGLKDHLHEPDGYATLSIPGSADYEKPMSIHSDKTIGYIIDDICTMDWVDSEKIGMVGFSFGAYWTFICAKTNPKIKFAVCNGIPFRYTLNPDQGLKINPIIAYALLCIFDVKHPIFLLSIVGKLLKRANDLLLVKGPPILAMNGDRDSIVDTRDTILIGEAPGNRLILIKNDDHCGLFHYQRMVGILVAWTRKHTLNQTPEEISRRQKISSSI